MSEKPTEFTKVWTVTEDMTAAHLRGKGASILSTPNMVSLMERTCIELCGVYLDEGMTTVGAEVHLKHLAPTPVGKEITAHVTLRSVERRKMWFDAEFIDENGKCGEGSHLRIMVTPKKMAEKAAEKHD